MALAAESAEKGEGGADSSDDGEVPALVFCTVCGRTDCAGCLDMEGPKPLGATPWETKGAPFLKRLWQTARLTTIDGEAFFGGLTDGSVASALGFAVACEVLAILSFAFVWGPLAYAFAPGFVESILMDPAQRRLAVFLTLGAVPLLSVLMVVLHVSWALGLEIGLRVAGTEAHGALSLRYALYACGWDLVTSPFGFGAGWVTGGFSGATAELRAAVRIPRLATRAYLGRARQADERTVRRAIGVAVVITATIVVGGAILAGTFAVAALL